MEDSHPTTPTRTTQPPSVTEQVAEAMRLLGSAYRGDWSDFDGRTLRDELNELSEHLSDDGRGTPFDLEDWAFNTNICPTARSWTQHCPDTGSKPYQCVHFDAWIHVRLAELEKADG